MADFSIMVDWTMAKEGGMSRAKTDWAAQYPAPYTLTYKGTTANDWHTNKGIQWLTFKEYAPKFGYTANGTNFAAMPYDLWQKIAKKVYWDAYNLDTLKSQAIANLLFQSAWGSGLQGSKTFWSTYFQKSFSTNADVTEYVKEKLKKTSDKTLFDSMWNARLNYLNSIPGQSANYAGWTARAESLRELSKPYLNQSQSAGFDSKSIIGILLLYVAYKAGEKLSNR